MSTVAVPVDEQSIKDCIQRVRADTPCHNRIAWMALGHVEGNPNSIDVIGENTESEDADLEEFINLLKEDQVMYGMVRLTTPIDMSTTVKFIYVHWVGEEVPFAKKGRFGVVSGSVEEYFHPHHLLVETGSHDDLMEEELIKRLEESSFTRNKIVSGSTDNQHHRGFTQHSTRNGHAAQTVHQQLPAGKSLEVSEELAELIAAVRDDSSEVTWLLTHFENSDIKNPLTLLSSGSGDIEELCEHLEYDQAAFALYRTTDLIDDIKTVKFVFIVWLGEDVKPLAKARLSTVAGSVEGIFAPVHVTISCFNNSDKDDLPALVLDKVSSSSGSKSFVK